ncbi:MAG: hypothetical protein HQ542_13645 [Bacteroidia bacterium]|nr:hypothetical protein [Bacteroidia bacterium]
MKNFTRILIAALLICAIAISCSKSEEDPPKNPDYPELIGTWQGTTWQQYPIEISVINKEGVLYISSYSFAVTRHEGGISDSTNYQMSISTGIVPLVDKYFSIPLISLTSTTDSISGSFDTGEMILAGTIRVVFQSGVAQGPFSAIKKTVN